MGKRMNVLTGVAGLNNRNHPARLSRENGIVELAEAVNIDISDRYKPKRRRGQLATNITSPAHSFHYAGPFVLCVSGSTLCKMPLDLSSLAIVRSGLTPDMRMTYVEQAGKIFYANGYEKGYVDVSGNDHSWYAPIEGYEAVDSSRRFSDPPVGHILADFAGRILIAQNNILWFTEPFAPFLIDKARNAIPFISRLKAVIPVDDGIFVSTSEKIVFLQGRRPEEMGQVEVASYPAIPGTVVYAQAEEIGDQSAARQVVVTTTTRGICTCSSGGALQNMTRGRLELPAASSGSAYIHDGKYVVNLKP